MELIKENVNIEQLVGSVEAQSVVEGELTLPGTKPDIVQLLLVQGKVSMGNVECVEGKLFMDGTVSFSIVYESENGVEGFEAVAGFKNSVDMQDAAPEMTGTVLATIQQIDSDLIDCRKLHVSAIVEMDCRVHWTGEEPVITGMHDANDYEMRRTSCSIPDIVRYKDHYMLREDAVISSSAPPVKGILFLDGYARSKEVRRQSEESVAIGEVKCFIIYSSPEGSLEQTQLVLPVEYLLSNQDAADSEMHNIQFTIKEMYAKIADEEGRVLSFEIELDIIGSSVRREDMDLISDCYSTEKNVDIRFKTMQTMIPCLSSNMRTSVKTRCSISEDDPFVAAPLVCFVRPLITQKNIQVDSMELQGILMIHMIYMQQNGNRASYTTQAPFTSDVEVRGLTPGMYCDINIAAENSYVTATGNDLDIKTSLDIELHCFTNWSLTMASEITEGEPITEKDHGIKIYFASNGDTLWSVAKRFHTKEDVIAKHNPSIDTQNDLPAGQRLLLLLKNTG